MNNKTTELLEELMNNKTTELFLQMSVGLWENLKPIDLKPMSIVYTESEIIPAFGGKITLTPIKLSGIWGGVDEKVVASTTNIITEIREHLTDLTPDLIREMLVVRTSLNHTHLWDTNLDTMSYVCRRCQGIVTFRELAMTPHGETLDEIYASHL